MKISKSYNPLRCLTRRPFDFTEGSEFPMDSQADFVGSPKAGNSVALHAGRNLNLNRRFGPDHGQPEQACRWTRWTAHRSRSVIRQSKRRLLRSGDSWCGRLDRAEVSSDGGSRSAA